MNKRHSIRICDVKFDLRHGVAQSNEPVQLFFVEDQSMQEQWELSQRGLIFMDFCRRLRYCTRHKVPWLMDDSEHFLLAHERPQRAPQVPIYRTRSTM